MTGRFTAIRPTAASHYRLMLFGAALQLAERAGAAADAVADDYRVEAAALWGGTAPSAAEWFAATEAWAQDHPLLPFQCIARGGLGTLHRRIVAFAALVEEDARLALLVEPDGGYPSLGGMTALWRDCAPGIDAAMVRTALLDCMAAGVMMPETLTGLRSDRRFRVSSAVQDMLSDEPPRMEGVRHIAASGAMDAAEWIAPTTAGVTVAGVAALLGHGDAPVLTVRGPAANGRKSLVLAAAAVAGCAVLLIDRAVLADPGRFLEAGAAAMAGHCMIVVEAPLAPGETLALPAHPAFTGAMAVITGMTGAVQPPAGRSGTTIRLPMPDPAARHAHWSRAGMGELAGQLGERRMTSGAIHAAAASARTHARARGAPSPEAADVRAVLADLVDPRLDMLSTPIIRSGPLDPLQLDPGARADFDALLLRCRHREALGHGTEAGVRALFAGPSGTGKTLGASHVAAALDRPLFRVDLAATMNKYIGETEKNLEQALCAAEERDIVLLLDEGDALMARRTDVGSSNDRYANMETNYLLQRIERFGGILIVTSNDAERIDPAFARRMDATLLFQPPDEMQREAILAQMVAGQAVSPDLIGEIACRCTLSGGQLRNVALHARLLALDIGGPIGDDQLRAAVQHEYRKTGGYCPLRMPLAAVG